MKSFTQFGIAALVAISSATAFASVDHHESFAPANTMQIPVGTHLDGGIDQATFNAVIANMVSVWTPIVKKAGGTLTFKNLWTDATVNSSAEQQGKKWIVNAYGGLARHKLMTKDAMMMVFCHEMGHHLGGYPKEAGIFGTSWASNEGEADYFATMKCFRRMTQDDDNASIVASLKIPANVKADCSSQLKDSKDIALCERSALIGLNLADILHDLSIDPKTGTSSEAAPDFATPDQTVVSTTNDQHPESQCRLDTYTNGSYCGISYTEDFAKDNPTTGACAIERGDKAGYRPTCWYKPLKN